MRALMVGLLALVVVAAGCDSANVPAVSAISPALPSESPDAVATVHPRPSATAAPTPSVLQLGEAYLVIATKANAAEDRLYKDLGSLPDTVRNAHTYCRRERAIEQEFVDGLATIPFTPKFKPLADKLRAARLADLRLNTKCIKAKSIAAVHKIYAQQRASSPAGTRAAAKLRLALGLSTRALY